MSYVYAPHAPIAARLAEVTAEMRQFGAPTIRAIWYGDHWVALEGSHRLAAAYELGLTPTIDELSWDDEIDHDFDDVSSRRVSDVLEYLGRGCTVGYRFDDLDGGTDTIPVEP